MFEEWLIGDGNYPPLHRDQLVRLSFELAPARVTVVPPDQQTFLEHRGEATYVGRGVVLRRYTEGDQVAVVEADGFRFYFYGSAADRCRPGDVLEFEGRLLLDHYLWVEFHAGCADDPGLFNDLRVVRIRRVTIPERFIHRHARGMSYPASVAPPDYGPVEEVETMDSADGLGFFVIDFEEVKGLSIPETFL